MIPLTMYHSRIPLHVNKSILIVMCLIPNPFCLAIVIHYSHICTTDGSSEQMVNYTWTRRDNVIFALCSTRIEDIENCSVQYSQDPHYINLTSPITGLTNTPFPVLSASPASLDVTTEALYYHQASIVIDASFEVVIRARDSFSFEGHVVMATSPFPTDFKMMTIELEIYQLALLGAVIAVLLLAGSACFCFVIVLLQKGTYIYYVLDMWCSYITTYAQSWWINYQLWL